LWWRTVTANRGAAVAVASLFPFELGRQARPGRQKGKINPGDTGSQPKQLHIMADF
jgi:hypothetical protein